MHCNNCRFEYSDNDSVCPNCGRSSDVKSDFSFSEFWRGVTSFVGKQNFSKFQKIACTLAAITFVIFLICTASTGVAQISLSWLCPIAAFIMLVSVFHKYDTASIPMAISYSMFLLPNLINVIRTFGYLRGAYAAITFILCILMYGNLVIIWLLTAKVIKNTPIFKMIVAISSILISFYELYYLFRTLSVSFISSLHAIGWIGFVGTQAAILVAYDKKRILGIISSTNTPSKNASQTFYTSANTPTYNAPTPNANAINTEQQAVASSEQATEQQFIFCSQCGKKLPIDSAFCEYCGSKINQ